MRLASLAFPPVLWLLFLLLAARGQAQSPSEIAWLNQHLSAIAHLEPGPDVADLLPLAPLVSQARVVGLGEATHGSREFFQLKHRLVDYLVTQQGFTTFAIEADYGWAEILNDYIQTGQGDSLTVHSATGFEVWNTTEFWELVEWMRRYNQAHTRKLRYVGIDMQDPYPNLFRLEQFALQRADTVLRRQVRELQTCYFALPKNPYQAAAATTRRIVRLSDQLVEHLRTGAVPATLQQHGQVLRQRAQLLQQGLRSSVRDQAMARNVGWLLAQEPTAKIVIWAHNAHLRRDARSKRMGSYLAQQLGPAYVAAALSTGRGTANIFAADGRFLPIPLQVPVANSCEAWLDQATASTYWLSLRPSRDAGPAAQWLQQKHLFRQLGGAAQAQGQFSWYPPLPEAFDALLYVRHTSASQSYRAAHPPK
ncbi:erythromycin esterase family protein [Hymenobacter sp. YC55]|uniref:erythromycin esterase family protein n=1 Tax=Hymenobacter sp. YC55 TaxID=3034019 RepID=UPI0023F7C2AB|nr:erythromycin esterase family protein [Hymenobacter sp. YC55]MDF7815226.1 erythromycin esterase family protein [Hymenobacter sp. YC55]